MNVGFHLRCAMCDAALPDVSPELADSSGAARRKQDLHRGPVAAPAQAQTDAVVISERPKSTATPLDIALEEATAASRPPESRTVFCTSCGREQEADRKFCTQCGKPMRRAAR